MSCSKPETNSKTIPLVIAHRGDSALAPENTLAAYSLALEKGIQAAECDVVLSRDRVPFLLHDDSLDRTTDGTGPPGDFDWADLKELDAGRWKGADWKGERLPSLADFLALHKDKALAVVEIKEEGIETECLKVLDESGLETQHVMLFSFHKSVMKDLAGRMSSWPRTWLVGSKDAKVGRRDLLFQSLRTWGLSGLGFDRRVVDRDLVDRGHEAGLKIFVWTVNDEDEALKLADLGVDAIISDRPALLRSALQSAR